MSIENSRNVPTDSSRVFVGRHGIDELTVNVELDGMPHEVCRIGLEEGGHPMAELVAYALAHLTVGELRLAVAAMYRLAPHPPGATGELLADLLANTARKEVAVNRDGAIVRRLIRREKAEPKLHDTDWRHLGELPQEGP